MIGSSPWIRWRATLAAAVFATGFSTSCSRGGADRSASLLLIQEVCQGKPAAATAAFRPQDKAPAAVAFEVGSPLDQEAATGGTRGSGAKAVRLDRDYLPEADRAKEAKQTQLVVCVQPLPAEQIQTCQTSGKSSTGVVVRYRAKAMMQLVEARTARPLVSETIVADAKDCPEVATTKNDESSQLAEVYDGREELKEAARDWYTEMAAGSDSPAAAAQQTKTVAQTASAKTADVAGQCEALNRPLRGEFFSAYAMVNAAKGAVTRSWRGSDGIAGDAQWGLNVIDKTRSSLDQIQTAMHQVTPTDLRLQEYRDRYVRSLKAFNATLETLAKDYNEAKTIANGKWDEDRIKALNTETRKLARSVERQHRSLDRLRWELFSYCLQPNTIQASR